MHQLMTFDEFDEQYPERLTSVEGSGWEDEDGNSCFFETFGADLDYVRSLLGTKKERRIWTVMDGGWLVSGYHLVNRSGFLVTKKKWPAGATIEVFDEKCGHCGGGVVFPDPCGTCYEEDECIHCGERIVSSYPGYWEHWDGEVTRGAQCEGMEKFATPPSEV